MKIGIVQEIKDREKPRRQTGCARNSEQAGPKTVRRRKRQRAMAPERWADSRRKERDRSGVPGGKARQQPPRRPERGVEDEGPDEGPEEGSVEGGPEEPAENGPDEARDNIPDP